MAKVASAAWTEGSCCAADKRLALVAINKVLACNMDKLEQMNLLGLPSGLPSTKGNWAAIPLALGGVPIGAPPVGACCMLGGLLGIRTGTAGIPEKPAIAGV